MMENRRGKYATVIQDITGIIIWRKKYSETPRWELWRGGGGLSVLIKARTPPEEGKMKEMNTFIQQGRIKLIKSVSKDI